jgi:transcription elongation factor GreA
VKNLKSKATDEYAIVGSAEADPMHKRLSNESPIGKALLGRTKGEKVTVTTPRGSTQYQVVKIQAGD